MKYAGWPGGSTAIVNPARFVESSWGMSKASSVFASPSKARTLNPAAPLTTESGISVVTVQKAPGDVHVTGETGFRARLPGAWLR
jgi:hypothetical protein